MPRPKKNAPPMDINQKCNHCDKVFKRPCDWKLVTFDLSDWIDYCLSGIEMLIHRSKHEKTLSRPWKCTEPSCKYFQVGWSTEKERDRHINDKHSKTRNLYICQFQPCTYASARESNCKQHMEKAHGWVYVRSKNSVRRGRMRGSSLKATRKNPCVSTPASKLADLPNPVSGPNSSPRESPTFPETLPFSFNDPPVAARSDNYPPIFSMSNGPNSFSTSFISIASQAESEAGNDKDLITDLEMRELMNPKSFPSADSFPDPMGPYIDGSPLFTTDNTSLNFDLEWSLMDMPSTEGDHNSLEMQLPIQDHSKPFK